MLACEQNRTNDRLLRVDHLERGTAVSLADLAFELGHADPAHFTCDRTAAVRMPPSHFARAVHE
jgi:transcriptional regulator GlxA family with amidase domain